MDEVKSEREAGKDLLRSMLQVDGKKSCGHLKKPTYTSLENLRAMGQTRLLD